MRLFIYILLIPFILLSACLPSSTSDISTVSRSTKPTETFMPPATQPEPASMTLQKGINFGNMLEGSDEGDFGLNVQEQYFDLVKEAGFDFVRLPVNWKAHTTRTSYDDGDTGYTIEPAFFVRVDEVVSWALKRNLSIIIDFHNYEDLMIDPNLNQFSLLWKQIAEHYQDYPLQVLFELANEPHDQMTVSLWNKYILDVLKVIRESNPTRDVIIGPVQWNAYDWITTLDIPDDPHIIVTFHYYEPFQFTHQGAEWVEGSNLWLGTTWDATDSEKSEITNNFDFVSDWSRRHRNIRILLGEFGTDSKAPEDARVRWTTFVREQAEAHGFAWAYWELASNFGVYDPDAKVWREDLLEALIP